MILSAQSIRKRLNEGLLSPWNERAVSRNGMTYGLSIAGYDIRLTSPQISYLMPGGFTLGASVEHFHMPLDLIAFVHDKSTWARKGLAVQNTVIEPGWSGYLTLELTNHSSQPIMLDNETPIAQIVFQLLDEPVERPYSGKYQNQGWGPQPAKYER